MPKWSDLSREYGGHDYGDGDFDYTHDCKYGCGCSMGPSNSGGPLGLDPGPGGECPGNPKDGERLPGNDDYQTVVERRIRKLDQRAFQAEDLLKRVEPGAIELAEQLKATQRQLCEAQQRADQAIKILAG